MGVLAATILMPFIFAIFAVAHPSDRQRPLLLPMAGALNLAAAWMLAFGPDRSAFGGWLVVDGLGKLVLLTNGFLFLMCSIYALGYLAARADRRNQIFVACMLILLAMMSLIACAQNVGLLWVASASLTLFSAPLVYFNRNARSLEAVWKYLFIGSVGIALALLGTFFLAYSALGTEAETTLIFADLVRVAPKLSPEWLHSAFILLFVGYGTKMGLAPMHTWKPDVYGEAPGLVGSLLAGSVTGASFVGVLRFVPIVRQAGGGAFAAEIMVAIGILSMLVGAAFMTRQRDFKRLLAYSSVEHMGILIAGVGLGGWALFGALLHFVNNALAKGVLFLSAGNIRRAFGSKSIEDVSGAIHVAPASAGLLLAGFFAITGTPPFGPFISELTILRAAFDGGRYGVAALFLIALAIVFVNMGRTILAVVHGEPPPGKEPRPFVETISVVAPAAILLAIVLVLGVYVPAPLDRLLRDAASSIDPGWLPAPPLELVSQAPALAGGRP